jgi:acyl dehydratase
VTTYFEDIAVGDTGEFGTYDVTEEEILEFAGKYDPQPFHTDPEAASETIYGGLIASGWHTCAMTMRLLVDHHFDESAAMGARGVEELRFPQPVRPGDSLSVRTEVLERSVDDEDRGTVRVRSETVTDHDELVLSMISEVMYARR